MSVTLLLGFLAIFQDPGKDAEKAIQNLRSQKCYRTKFKAIIEAPGSDPLKLEGESVWVNPGVLYIQYRDTGKDQKCIVRVGDKVWIYHELLEDWVTSEEMGSPGAGRGVQNPDEILGVLLKHAEKAKAGGGGITLDFAGADIEKIMQEQASQGGFDWKASKASAGLVLTKGLVSRLSSVANLVSLDEKLKGKEVKYSADVEIVDINQDPSLKFTILDEKKRPVDIAIPEHVLKEIEGFLAKKP